MTTYRWIESPAWQLDFFGIPHRIPWLNDVAEPDEKNAFELEDLLNACEAMVKEEPEAAQAWQGFMAAAESFDAMTEALEDQEYARAAELLVEIQKHHPDSPYGLFHQAFVARQSGQDQEALRLYTEAANKAPGIPFIWTNLGALLAENGQRDQAVQAFLNTLHANPKDQAALESLVRLKAAVKLQKDQKDPNSVFYLPVEKFREVAQGNIAPLADKPDQLMQFAEMLLREGVIPDVGVQALEKLVEGNPANPRALIALGAGYRLIGQLEKSKAAITSYTELQPEDPWGFFNLAQTLNAAHDKDGELAALDKTLALDPNVQSAIGIRFQLKGGNTDPAAETQLMEFANSREAWMPLLLASSLARDRGDIATATQRAAAAYERNSKSEEVLLHYCAMLGDAGDGETLELVIQPAVTGGRYSKRLDWNYAQALRQVGKTTLAIEVLQRARLSEAPDDFKVGAEAAIDFWTGLRAQSAEKLEVHPSGTLLRPLLLTLNDGDGGILLQPRQQLPAAHQFKARVTESDGTSALVSLQQGQSGLGQPPRSLGTFVVKGAESSGEAPVTLDCKIEATPDGRVMFGAAQNGRKLPVEWMKS